MPVKVRANKTFAGLCVSMRKGEEKAIPEGAVLNDLLKCGYVSLVEVDDGGGNESKRGYSRRREKSPKS